MSDWPGLGQAVAVRGGQVPRHVTPSVQRLADRLADVPLAIYDVTWTLLTANRSWAAVFGDPGAVRGRARNLVWRLFTGAGSPVRHADFEGQERSFAADLRDAAFRYPHDPELTSMIATLRQASDSFAALWVQPTVARHGGTSKAIAHAMVGDLTLDCDVLTVHDAELRIVVFTAAPSTPDAEKLAMLNVVGLQHMAPVEPA